MLPGTSFEHVLGDKEVDANNVTRIIFCSGKYYYTLAKERRTKNITDTALIRLEVGLLKCRSLFFMQNIYSANELQTHLSSDVMCINSTSFSKIDYIMLTHIETTLRF